MATPAEANESRCSPTVADIPGEACRATGPADRMAYMADLLLELADMAAAEGHTTLAGLLALAHQEARSKCG